MADLNTRISDFVWKNLSEKHFAGKKDPFWEALHKTGTELWLDTGDMDDVDPEFGRALWRGRKLAGSILAVGIDAAGIAITRSSGLRRSP